MNDVLLAEFNNISAPLKALGGKRDNMVEGPPHKKARLSNTEDNQERKRPVGRPRKINPKPPSDTHRQTTLGFQKVPDTSLAVETTDPSIPTVRNSPRTITTPGSTKLLSKVADAKTAKSDVKADTIPTFKKRGKAKLKSIKPPEFGKIDLPATSLVWSRLHLREFCIRFEKLLKMPARSLNLIADLSEPLDYLSQRNLVVALLKAIDFADELPIPPEEIRRTLKEISKAPEDSNVLWDALHFLLKQQDEVTVPDKEQLLELEDEHLFLLVKLVDVASAGDYIRKEIDNAAHELRLATVRNTRDRVARRQEYELTKQAMHRKKLTISTKEDSENWQAQWEAAADKHKAKMLQFDADLWEIQRSKNIRTTPIGQDCMGNVYWSFAERRKTDSNSDLGKRLVVQTASGKSHPAGQAPDRNGSSDQERMDIDIVVDQNELDDEHYQWFDISSADDAATLAKWISYQAKVILPPKPKLVDGRSRESRQEKKRQTLMAKMRHASLVSGLDSAAASEVGEACLRDDLDLLDDNGDGDESMESRANVKADQVADHPKENPNAHIDHKTLEQWVQIEALVKRIEDFAHYKLKAIA